MKLRAAVFDLDGTILDTLEDLMNSLNRALAQTGFPTRTLDQVRGSVGNGWQKMVERSVPEGTEEDKTARILKIFAEDYQAHSADLTAPYPGIVPMLEKAKQAGLLLAVVSNKADASAKSLVKHYFGDIFDVTVGERTDVAKKPAPDAVNLVLDTLSVKREESVYIGDSDVDLLTAENAGVPCIGVAWGFKGEPFLREHGAKQIVQTPEELLLLLLSGMKEESHDI